MYTFQEVDGEAYAEVLRSLNDAHPKFPELEDKHFELGFWWLLRAGARTIVGFAGLVPFTDPCIGIGYCKRAWVSPDHRGRGLQVKMIQARETKAKELGWHLLVTETTSSHSERSLRAVGFETFDPDQKWGEPGSTYLLKRL